MFPKENKIDVPVETDYNPLIDESIEKIFNHLNDILEIRETYQVIQGLKEKFITICCDYIEHEELNIKHKMERITELKNLYNSI